MRRAGVEVARLQSVLDALAGLPAGPLRRGGRLARRALRRRGQDHAGRARRVLRLRGVPDDPAAHRDRGRRQAHPRRWSPAQRSAVLALEPEATRIAEHRGAAPTGGRAASTPLRAGRAGPAAHRLVCGPARGGRGDRRPARPVRRGPTTSLGDVALADLRSVRACAAASWSATPTPPCSAGVLARRARRHAAGRRRRHRPAIATASRRRHPRGAARRPRHGGRRARPRRSPAASGSGSCSPGRSPPTPRCWSSSSRPAPSTPTPRRASPTGCATPAPAGPRVVTHASPLVLDRVDHVVLLEEAGSSPTARHRELLRRPALPRRRHRERGGAPMSSSCCPSPTAADVRRYVRSARRDATRGRCGVALGLHVAGRRRRAGRAAAARQPGRRPSHDGHDGRHVDRRRRW